MQNFLRVLPQYLVPQHLLTRVYGWLANIRCTYAKNWMINTFIKKYHVDMSIAEKEKPEDYPTFNSFFTRHLKARLRPIVQHQGAIACPCDGLISQVGLIDNTRLFQAKGLYYSIESLLGGNKERAKQFEQGHFATIYLAPKDYHRVHMPITGQLQDTTYVPGSLFSVNQLTASTVPNLFTRNERLISYFETETGPLAVVLVGAMIVGNIQTVWDDNPRSTRILSKSYSGVKLHRGDELGLFNLGSTVIILFSKNKVSWTPDLLANTPVKMGEQLGTINI